MTKRRTLGKRRRRNTQYTRTKNKTKYFRKTRGGMLRNSPPPPPPPPMPRSLYTWPSPAPRPAAPLPPRLPGQSPHPKGDDTKRPKSQTS